LVANSLREKVKRLATFESGCNCSGFGAPEEIRAPDPQIRSLYHCFDLAPFFCKPDPKGVLRINALAGRLQTKLLRMAPAWMQRGPTLPTWLLRPVAKGMRDGGVGGFHGGGMVGGSASVQPCCSAVARRVTVAPLDLLAHSSLHGISASPAVLSTLATFC
jgi:hypothetical protein